MAIIKVLHILQSSEFSGAENVVCQIVDMFRNNNNYEMAYCSPEGKIDEVLRKRNILYFPINRISIGYLNEIIDLFQPDILHTHDALASVLAAMTHGKRKIIAHIHGNHLNMRKVTIKALLVKLFAYRFSQIIWVSHSSYDNYYFRKYVKDKSIILPNIILKEDIERKLMEDSNTYSYDCVVLGRINDIKNPLRALKIFEQVMKEKKDLSVAFIGDGDLMQACKEFIIEHKMQQNIVMLGYRSNPIKMLAGSKILVMTSIYEGTPMSALEAMGVGLPIISTPTDGLVDLIVNEVTGYYSDEDTELAKKILEVLSSEETQHRMRENTLKRFDYLVNVEKYKNSIVKIYQNALEG